MHAQEPVTSCRAKVVSAASVCDEAARLIAVAPARVSLAGGVPRHIPAMHDWPVGQARPHIPQLEALVMRLMHAADAPVPQAV